MDMMIPEKRGEIKAFYFLTRWLRSCSHSGRVCDIVEESLGNGILAASKIESAADEYR